MTSEDEEILPAAPAWDSSNAFPYRCPWPDSWVRELMEGCVQSYDVGYRTVQVSLRGMHSLLHELMELRKIHLQAPCLKDSKGMPFSEWAMCQRETVLLRGYAFIEQHQPRGVERPWHIRKDHEQ